MSLRGIFHQYNKNIDSGNQGRERDYQTKGLELEEEENGRDESDEGEADDNRTEDSL